METVVSLFGVQPLRIGGAEIYTRELSLQLAERGWRHVAVFSGPATPAVREYLADLPNLTLESIPAIEDSAVNGAKAVWKALSKHRPKILHFQFTSLIGPYSWLGKLAGAEKVFFTAQGSSPTGFVARRAPLWKRLAARVVNAPLTGVFCISENVRQILRTQDMVPAQRLHRLYNAIYIPELGGSVEQGLAFRQRFGIPIDKELVVQVSWVIPEKGIPDLLEAARLVLAKRPNTHFAIAGNGNYTGEYQRAAAHMGIGGSVTWCGLLENPMRDGVYAAADVFCLLSRWEEAFGWVIAEAMSFERPVVATAVGGIPEVVADGVTGLLGPRSEPGVAAGHMLQLLGDAELRRRMGAAGRKRVREMFELRSGVKELIAHYGI